MKHASSIALSTSLLSVVYACSSGSVAPVPTPATAGFGGAAAGAGKGEGGALLAGNAGGAASGSGGGLGALGGGGGLGGTAGDASASAGGAGLSSAGSESASAGSSPAAGAANAAGGQSGAGGVTPEGDRAAAEVLAGFQLLDPCQSSYKAVATAGDVCPQDAAVKNQKVSLHFGGDSAVTYQVTLRVRGVMEGYWYSGGMLDSGSKKFYVGGVPTVGGFASACKNHTSELPFALPHDITPTDDCWNGFNMFALTVSAPAQHFYLNYTSDKNGDRPPHAVYDSDYTVTVAIQGQADLVFYVIGSDEHECYGFKRTINGVSTTPSPYTGQFAQFDVVSVKRAD